MSLQTLFSQRVEESDGFCTKAILNQGEYVFPYVSVEFFLHRPPPALLKRLMEARERGWWLDYMYLPTCHDMVERWFVRQSGCKNFNAEWDFARSFIVDPARVSNQDELRIVSPHLFS